MINFNITLHLGAFNYPRKIFVSFSFILLCLSFASQSFSQGPSITYTALSDVCIDGNRTLTATITDPDGVPRAGIGRPVLYWNYNSYAYNAVTGVSIGGGQFQFTFGAGAFAPSFLTYYIVAQDSAAVPNVSVFPSAGASGFSVNPPNVSIRPTYPSSYIVKPTLSGTYLVGSGQIFTTLTDAFNAYNSSCLNGPVTFLLTDPVYGTNSTSGIIENFPITIYNPQASTVNTLTVKPNTGVTATITGKNDNALFKFYGADYVTFDGSNAGTTTRNLTIKNDTTSINATVFWLSSFNNSDGCNGNVIKNCIISGNASSTTFACIAMSSGVFVTNSSDAANSNNSIINNIISTSYYGIYMNGLLTGESGNVISGNTIGSSLTSSKFGYRSLFAANQNNIIINNNTIVGILSSNYSGAEADATAGIVISGLTSGGNIYNNKIYDIKNTNNAGAATYGISLQSTTVNSGLKVYNNFIHSIIGYGKASNVYENGIGVAVLSGGGYGIYYNSIFLRDNQNTSGISSCLFIGPNVSGTIDVRNNIFSNRQTSGIRYSVYSSLPRTVFSTINYNDYFSTGYIGYFSEPPISNLALWQAATAADGGSTTVDPIFVNSTGTIGTIDLHLQNASSLNDQGIAISGITIDIDGVNRSATTPDIGADEFTPPACLTNFGGTASSISSQILCVTGQPVLVCSGFDFGAGMTYQWESSTDSTTWTAITGETNPTTANPPVISVSTFYRLRVKCGSGTAGYSNVIKITIKNPQITSTIPASRCGTGSLTLTANANVGTTVQWYANASGGVPIATGTTYTTPAINTTTTYYAEPAYIGSSGVCGPVSPAAVSSQTEFQLTAFKVYFDVLQATTLASVDIYPKEAGVALTLEVYNTSNTLIGSNTIVTNVTNSQSTPTNAQTVPINVFMLPGNGYTLYIRTDDVANPLGSGLIRNYSGVIYPYLSDNISITGHEYTPVAGDPSESTMYGVFYNWKYTTGCTLSRIPVAASITTPADFTLNGTTSICNGSSTTLTATSTNTSYSYSWSPGALTGASVTVSPTADIRYTVTAVAGTCTNVKTIDVSVSDAPSSVTLTNNAPVAPNAFCNGSVVTLTASGGVIPSLVSILNEKFEGNGLPTGWDTLNINPAATYTIAGKWTQRSSAPIPFTHGGSGFRSNDTSKFYMAYSDESGSSTLNTSLRTPRLDFTGYDSVSLSFYQTYLPFLAPDSINVEYFRTGPATGLTSINSTSGIGVGGTGWTTIYKAGPSTSPLNGVSTNITASIGSSVNFVQRTINLTPFLTPSATRDTFYLRFRYVGKANKWWAIDNVKIVGRGGSPITWTPITGLYDNVTCTNPYTGTVFNPTVYAKVTSPVTYTAISGTPNGCSSSASVTLTPRPLVSAIMSGSTTICPNGSANISIALTGKAPWRIVYSKNGVNQTAVVTSANPYVFSTGPLTANTTYAFATSNAVGDSVVVSTVKGCYAPTSALTGNAVITIGSLKGNITGSPTVCSGNTANISISLTGSPPWYIQYNNGSSIVPVSNITTNPYVLTVNPSLTSTFTLDSLRDQTGCTALRDSLTGSALVTVNATGTASIAGSSTICAGISTPLTATFTGTPPWNFTYTNGTTPVTVNNISSSPYIFNVTPSAPSSYTISSMTDGNGCTAAPSGISGQAEITFGAPITGSLTGSTSICENGSTNLTVTLTGNSPWSITYNANGANPVTINNISSSPYSFSVSPAGNTTYVLTSVITANGCTASLSNLTSNAVISVNASTTTTWTGISSNWFDGNNWCGGVPTSTRDVLIPSGISNMPVISGGNATARNLTINSGATLTIQNNGSINVAGNTINNGELINSGTFTLNGTLDQSFPGGTTGVVSKMNVLEINKNTGFITLDRKFAITDTGVLRIKKATTVNINDTIILKSGSIGTSRIDSIVSTATLVYNGTGCFTVERYIPTGVTHGKSWQLLAAPTKGQTINQAWQEGATAVSSNPMPGYGTTITSNLSGATSLGFDFFTPSGTTLKLYDPVTNTYLGLPNTTNTQISSPKGYMFFVRGDRSVLTSTAPAVPVTLRTTGKIFYGTGADSALSLAVPAGKFQCVGNPYASTIDFQRLLTTSIGLQATYYVLDPTLQSGNGLGAFQTISQFNAWQPFPGGTLNYSGTVARSTIPSGQGFFVYSGSGGNVKFAESNKVSSNTNTFRNTNFVERSMLKVYLKASNGTMLDGNILALDSTSSNGIDDNDVLKLFNYGENIGINNSGRFLAIDVRNNISDNDTVFYSISNFRIQEYSLLFTPTQFDIYNLEAHLVDRYTNTSTSINLADSFVYNFEANANPFSRQSDRFFIVFKTLRTLPVSFTGIRAKTEDSQIKVEWDVAGETGVNRYEILKSSDGVHFVKMSSQIPVGNNGSNYNYHCFDPSPVNGYNFYRVRSIGNAGDEKYTNIVKVWYDNTKSQFVVAPNPIKDNKVNISFVNQPAGVYLVELFDNLGKLITYKSIRHSGTPATKFELEPDFVLASGVYLIKINTPSKNQFAEKISVK